MANPWFRLWADMANDPKWRTIARVSKQKIGDVVAVYIHMMTCASNATVRGTLEGWSDEDAATALDIDTEQVEAIRTAMQGRVLDGSTLAGWHKRQPKREDSSGDRVAAHRAKQASSNASSDAVTHCNAMKRTETLEEKREEKIRGEDSNSNELLVASPAADLPELLDIEPSGKPPCPHKQIVALYHEILPMCPQIRDWTPARAEQLRARWNEAPERQNLDYWKRFFEYVKTCGFLVGIQPDAKRRPFFADLEWLTKQANFTKVREGRYEPRD